MEEESERQRRWAEGLEQRKHSTSSNLSSKSTPQNQSAYFIVPIQFFSSIPQNCCVCPEKATAGRAKFSVAQPNQKASNCSFNSMFLTRHAAQSDCITKPKDTLGHKARGWATVVVYQEQQNLYPSKGSWDVPVPGYMAINGSLLITWWKAAVLGVPRKWLQDTLLAWQKLRSGFSIGFIRSLVPQQM